MKLIWRVTTLYLLVTIAAPSWAAVEGFCGDRAGYAVHLPAQWKAEQEHLAVILTAPRDAGDVYVVCREYLLPDAVLPAREEAAARLYPIAAADKAQPDCSPLVETAKEAAARLGGRNLVMSEGVMHFTTPSGPASVSRTSGDKGLLCLCSDENTVREWAFDFVPTPGGE
jgi:hypothetical protein